MNIENDIKKIESSIKCLLAQIELLEDTCIKPIIKDSINTLYNEINALKLNLKE